MLVKISSSSPSKYLSGIERKYEYRLEDMCVNEALSKTDADTASSLIEAFKNSELGLFFLFVLVLVLVIIWSPPCREFLKDFKDAIESVNQLIQVVRRQSEAITRAEREISEANRDRNDKHDQLIEEFGKMRRMLRRLSSSEEDFRDRE
jgi:methyl-accepting chemotaxis protein